MNRGKSKMTRQSKTKHDSTQKGSIWNQKGFYLESKGVILWGQPNNPFGTLFSECSGYDRIYRIYWSGERKSQR
jgi:hypothetical protein